MFFSQWRALPWPPNKLFFYKLAIKILWFENKLFLNQKKNTNHNIYNNYVNTKYVPMNLFLANIHGIRIKVLVSYRRWKLVRDSQYMVLQTTDYNTQHNSIFLIQQVSEEMQRLTSPLLKILKST